MNLVIIILLGFLLVCALTVTYCRKLLDSIMIFMAYSVVMSIIWMILESPDLAITEAAVGAGITTLLFFITLRRLQKIDNLRFEETHGFNAEDAATEAEASAEEGKEDAHE